MLVWQHVLFQMRLGVVLFAPRAQLSGLIYLRVYKSGSWCQILHQGTRDKKRLTADSHLGYDMFAEV
jgi:hypothetical protein